MKPQHKRAAALVGTGLLGWLTGTFLPPEIIAQIIEAF